MAGKPAKRPSRPLKPPIWGDPGGNRCLARTIVPLAADAWRIRRSARGAKKPAAAQIPGVCGCVVGGDRVQCRFCGGSDSVRSRL